MISQFPVTFGKTIHVTHLFTFIYLFGSLYLLSFYLKKFFFNYLGLFQDCPSFFCSFAGPVLMSYYFNYGNFRIYLIFSRSSSPSLLSSTLFKVFPQGSPRLSFASRRGWMLSTPGNGCEGRLLGPPTVHAQRKGLRSADTAYFLPEIWFGFNPPWG